MNKKVSVSIGALIAVTVAFVLGILVGKGYADTETVGKEVVKIKPEYLPAVRDTIYYPQPYFIGYTDTVYQPIPAVVDTAAILKDYYLTRKYNLDFSNDSIGVFKVDLDVNRNMLANVFSEIRPIRTTIERTKVVSKVPATQFYTIAGTSANLKWNKIQVGIDLRQKYLNGVSGLRHNNDFGYTIDLGVKF